MIYLKISTKLRKYFLRKYQQICIIRHTCSIKCKYLKTHRDPTLIFGLLIVLYVRNKNIEKFFCQSGGFGVMRGQGHKVTTKDNFFIYIDTSKI